MGLIPNTTRRGAIYHFRRAVPTRLQPFLDRSELICSLGTSDPKVARALSRRAYLRSEDLFEALVAREMLTEDDISALVRDFYETVLARDSAVRLMRDKPLSESERQHRSDYYRELAENSRLDLAKSAFGSVRLITTAMVGKRFGGDAQLDKLDQRRAMSAILQAGIDVAEALHARAEGDFGFEPRDKRLKAALEQPAIPASSGQTNFHDTASPPSSSERAEAVVASPQTNAPGRPSISGPTFSVAAEQFREDQLRRKIWEQQTARQARKTFELFCERFGDQPLSAYTRRDAATFKALLEDLPALYGKDPTFKGKTAQQIVDAVRDLDVPRLSARTVQRHFAALSALWDRAHEREDVDANIFKGMKFAAAKRARDQREMWSSADLQLLFSSPVWTGCQAAHRRSKPGKEVIRDEKFWLPLIAVFSGMRQEEICQLRLDDILEVEGIWVFDLNKRSGQQLKNDSAVRLVPIHAELIRLGFVAYAEEQRQSRQERVFPGLQPGGADDRLGHNYSKWFSRYRKDVDLYATGRDFHSFRHSATTFLARAGVPTTTIDELTGHATPGETARYNKGLTVANLKKAIDQIDIGVNLARLYPCTESAAQSRPDKIDNYSKMMQ